MHFEAIFQLETLAKYHIFSCIFDKETPLLRD